MKFSTYLLLFTLGIIPPILIAQFQSSPGYLDSDYYFAGGIQIVNGQGFNEPYLWNYLDGTTSLPHPSHSYWAPLASIVAALGMWLTGRTAYSSGRLFFILIAGLVPPTTAFLAYKFSKSTRLSILSGLLAIFCVYHAPFLGVPDNFGIYMLLGGLYFIFVTRLLEGGPARRNWVILGLIAGLMTLARSDGLLWLAMTIAFALWLAWSEAGPVAVGQFIRNALPACLGFLAIMLPWYIRNFNIYGSFFAPGGSRALWLDNYDQTFIYPPDLLSLKYFLSLGMKEIIRDRLWALSINLQSAFAAHGGIILFPFIILGILYHRKDDRVRLAVLAWTILFLVMTVAFPFAGARGAFFHAGAALQPIWWSLAPLGLDFLLASLRRRNWGNNQTRMIFQSALILIAALLTGFVVYLRLFRLGWGEGEQKYVAVEQLLAHEGISQEDIVIVRNAPGYYLETGQSAISIPYGGEAAILEVARVFGARYLVVEPQAAVQPIQGLYEEPAGHAHFIYLGELDDTRIYRIELE